jgi:plastocyanin
MISSLVKRLWATVAAVLLVVGSFAVAAAPAEAATVSIKMGSDAGMLVFEPANVTIKPGDTVQFTINKVPPHNVIFNPKLVPGADKALAKSLSHPKMGMDGQAFDVTFPKDAPAGDYSFFCAPHQGAGMAGKITVAG